MGRYNKVYESDTGTLIVKPHYNNYNDKLKEWEDEICIKKPSLYTSDFITINIDEAKELITILSEIVNVVENQPQVGDSVEIIDGKLKGFSGRIVDIDKVANERELVVLIDRDEGHDEFYAYIDIKDVI